MKNSYENMKIIGVDETGVGDYFTPLVSAAVQTTPKIAKEFEKAGIRDSKMITDEKIVELAKIIKSKSKYSINFLSREKYNEINKKYNAHEMKMLIHIMSINDVEKKTNDTDLIILDQFASKENIKKYYKTMGMSNFNLSEIKSKMKVVTKGESEHVSVAAASILARAKLLELMDELNKKWGKIFPLGASNIVDKFGAKFLKENGIKSLAKVAKIKFKTTKKIQEIIKGENND